MKSIDTLAALKADGYVLHGHCRGHFCGHAAILPIDMLIEKFGPDYVFIREKRIAASIVCKSCGTKGGTLTISPTKTN